MMDGVNPSVHTATNLGNYNENENNGVTPTFSNNITESEDRKQIENNDDNSNEGNEI